MFGWFRRRPTEPPRLELGTELEFLGAQKGEDEERLTRALAALLAESGRVQRAYLARVRYANDPQPDVALCLVGEESDALHDRICKLFWAMFEQGQHLDVVFVEPAEEERLRRVCEPFFGA